MRGIVFLAVLTAAVATAEPSWNIAEPVPTEGRENIYRLDPDEWRDSVRRGKHHILDYPVRVTGALIPYKPVKEFLDDTSPNPLRAFIQAISKVFTQIQSFAASMRWLGLHSYPDNAGHEDSDIPLPEGFQVGDPMGLSLQRHGSVVGMTFSCAACHTGQLFGRPVIGLTNRFPRANLVFVRGKQALESIPSPLFSWVVGASREERRMYRRTRHNMAFVAAKRPEVLGLDTSLAHVALSLARRELDGWASKNPQMTFEPRDEVLSHYPGDSKPAVWWGMKYKNRWLSDGSVLSGNPIVTNILWNEIGRGTDLKELSEWLANNEAIVRQLTAAVFASRAPAMSEFFAEERFDIQSARRGQAHYQRQCAGCHGQYLKNWDRTGSESWPLAEQLKTYQVIYHRNTPVVDVGTDSHRREAMRSLEQLNQLEISKQNRVLIARQHGYVPPPLEGVWARWPYLHNNSVPSLCALLSRAADRPQVYYSGEANDPEQDFDFSCNGYPQQAPPHWQNAEHRFDSRRPGLSNQGHEYGVQLSVQEKRDLIHFLQTL